jgi:hypothetical protein
VTDEQPRETLQDLVLTRLAELGGTTGPMSARQAIRHNDAHEYVSYETVRVLARGLHSGGLTDRVAEGLSRALRVPLERVYRAAGVPMPGDRWTPPNSFARLTPSDRQLLEDVGNALLNAYDRGFRAASGE